MLLWPEYDDEHVWAALRRTLSTLRAARARRHLTIDRETVSLIPGAGFWVDVTEFRARLAACRTHGHAAADVCHARLAPLAEAAALYRDDLLAGFTLRDSAEFDDWQFTQAESLRAELAEALEKLARAAIWTRGTSSMRWHWLGAGWRWTPCGRRRTVRSCGCAPGPISAMRPCDQYRECVRILEQELGVAPLAETTELYEAIKSSRPAAASRAVRSSETRQLSTRARRRPDKSSETRPIAPRSCGRAAELTALVRAHERHATGGYFVAVEGEAGIGKTRAGGGVSGPGPSAGRGDYHGARLRGRSQCGLRPRSRRPARRVGSVGLRRPAGCAPRPLAG